MNKVSEMSERSGAREQSEQCGVSERSDASEGENGRASGPVLTSGFLIILDLSASVPTISGEVNHVPSK